MPENTAVVSRPPRYLARCAAIALWGFSLILFLMQLPWIAVRMNPGTLECGVESLKTQTMVTFAPLFIALGAMVTALFFSAAQNKFLASAAKDRGHAIGKAELRRLFLPFCRQKEIRRLLGDVPLLKASGWCFLFFWGAYLFWGLLSPLPPFFLLAGVLLFFASAGKLSPEKLSAPLKIWTAALLIVFSLSSMDGFAALNSLEKQTSPHGIPSGRAELKQLIYQKETPGTVYNRLAETANLPANRKFLKDLIEAQHFYTAHQSWKQKVSQVLKTPELHAFFQELTAELDAGKTAVLDLQLDRPYLWHPGANWYFSRIAGAYYSSLVFEAIEKRDKGAMMKNFLRLARLYEGLQRGDFIISLSYIFLNELNFSCTLGAVLGSRMLTLEDLAELTPFFRDREEKLRAALFTALKGEAVFERELILDMARVYPWLQNSETQGNALYESRVMQFLLRGNLPLPPHIWNAVMNRKALECSRFKFDFFLKSLEGKATCSQWKKSLPELEKYLLKNGSYFVMLNYNAARTAVIQLYHAVTCVRMSRTALEIEKFRLVNKRLPADLKELKIPLPQDAVSGEPLSFDNRKISLTFYRDKKEEVRTFPGWQLAGTEKEHIKLLVPLRMPR